MALARQRTFKSGVRWTGCLPRPRGPQARRRQLHRQTRGAAGRTPRGAAVLAGQWHDGTLGAVTFQEFVETDWLPSKHIEADHPGGLRLQPEQALLPVLRPPADRQDPTRHWSRTGSPSAAAGGLSPRSIRKYHTMLHSIFKRAVRDRLILSTRATHTELPKVIARKTRTLTPEEFDAAARRDPRAAPADGRDRDRDRDALGRADRPAPPAHRLPAPHPHRRGDHRRGLQEALPHRRSATSSSPTPRTTSRAPSASARTGSTPSPSTSRPTASAATTCSSPPTAGHPDLPQHLPHPRLAPRRQGQRRRLRCPHPRPAPRPRLLAPRRRLRPQVA